MLIFSNNLFSAENNYLRHKRLNSNELILSFKYNITSVKYFKINKGGITKHIYDIQGGILSKGMSIASYKHSAVKAFRLGQYRKDILRLVIESKRGVLQKHKVLGNVLVVPLGKGKVSYTKSITRIVKPKGPFVVIDAGHGGRDNGASRENIKEKWITLSIAKKLKKSLVDKGYRVYLTRTNDTYIPLPERTASANRLKADLFVSIHVNASPRNKENFKKFQGIEVFHLTTKNSPSIKRDVIYHRGKAMYSKRDFTQMTSRWKIAKSRRLAWHVHRHLLGSIHKKHKFVSGGIKKSDFWVLLSSKMPSVLVETGYLTNKVEGKRLLSSSYQNLIVNGISKGIDSYFKR